MGLSCAAYKSLDWFKRTWLASKVIFHGQKFERFEVITAEGVVLAPEHAAQDGDRTFNVAVSGFINCVPLQPWMNVVNWHCELEPCADDALKAQAAALKAGDKVRITGNRLYDPTHFSIQGHWEIHPVTAIEVLK